MHLGATRSKSVSSMTISLFIPLKSAYIVGTEGGGRWRWNQIGSPRSRDLNPMPRKKES